MIPKFRAFLKDTKQIVDVEVIFFENGVAKVTDNNFYQFEDLVLMQSTGLHSKQGVEIFEGDVVTSDLYPFTSERGKGYVGEVFYGKEDAMFLLELKCVNKELGGISDGMVENFADREVELCEVIGNIYENPELLEVV